MEIVNFGIKNVQNTTGEKPRMQRKSDNTACRRKALLSSRAKTYHKKFNKEKICFFNGSIMVPNPQNLDKNRNMKFKNNGFRPLGSLVLRLNCHDRSS